MEDRVVVVMKHSRPYVLQPRSSSLLATVSFSISLEQFPSPWPPEAALSRCLSWFLFQGRGRVHR